ncbi:MAG: dipeptide ABC transporter ATP-binding protein [Victivallaceae bacterium]|nr:dipeptide ABC transporter ATP-binding protein [Victivallaceae bacterium]
MALLEVKQLKVWYPVAGKLFQPKRYVKAVDGVDLSIATGETVGLVGESGCGKSTLGRAVVRLETPHAGTITIKDMNIAELHGSKLRRARSAFQMIFQDPYGSLNPRMTVFAAINEVLQIHSKLNRNERAERTIELLEMVNLGKEQMFRYPHQFSGGQRQRIGIARALAVNPQLIIADEPVSALDVSVQAQVINLLMEIQRKTDIAFLFIAHDLAVVEHISSRIMVMYLGKIVESGSSKIICSKPRHPYTSALLSAVPTINADKRQSRTVLNGDVPSPIDPPSGCPFHPRCPVAQEKCRKESPQLQPASKTGKQHLVACFFPIS